MSGLNRTGGHGRAAPDGARGALAIPYGRWLIGLAILLASAGLGGDWRFAVMGAAAAYFFVACGDLLDRCDD